MSVFLSAAAHAQAVSTGSVRLALIEESETLYRFLLATPLEALLNQERSSGTLAQVDLLPAYYNGGDYRFLLPRADFAQPTMPGVALEMDSETALVFPPVPSFLTALTRKAEDPATFGGRWSLSVSSHPLTVSLVQTLTGEGLVSALLHPEAGEGAQWHNTVMKVYRLRWDGADLTVAVAGKVSGGLPRLSAALKALRGQGPPLIGVSRGGVFGSALSDLKGRELALTLERLGLSYSSVGAPELRRWRELEAYRRERPDGIRFLSANLVLSSAPAVSLLPDHAIVEAGGLRVALVGITPPAASRYLSEAGLSHAVIAPPLSVQPLLARLRGQADLILLLCRLDPETILLRRLAFGVDAVLAEDPQDPDDATRPAEVTAAQAERRAFEPPLLTMRAFAATLDLLEADVARGGARRRLNLREKHVLLDQSAPTDPAFPEFEPESFGIALSSEPGLVPAARSIFPVQGVGYGVTAEEFWAMAASLTAEETGAELGILPVHPLPLQLDAAMEAREKIVRLWLQTGESLVTVWLKGSQVQAVLDESKRLAAARARGEAAPEEMSSVVGGLGPDATVHGSALESDGRYRVITTKSLAAANGWSPEPGAAAPLDDLALQVLRRRRGSEPERYRKWMAGRPAADRGFWRVNFRDVGLNVQNTQVVRDDAFNTVPSPRIQGSDELRIGGTFKTDADYLRGRYRWGNTIELDYARSRLRPRGQPAVTNVTANRLSLLTTGTRRAGAVLAPWLARSWGPSLGLGFEGQLEATPPLKRRQIYSASPGVEFYDGSFVRTLRVAANIKRDYSLDIPSTQYGLGARTLFAKSFGRAPISLEGEAWANYFFLMKRDQAQDLRFEGELNLKLRIPIRKHLSVAPFVDFYLFGLKTQPLWGYSAMTGITIGFSRLWKPQYESF